MRRLLSTLLAASFLLLVGWTLARQRQAYRSAEAALAAGLQRHEQLQREIQRLHSAGARLAAEENRLRDAILTAQLAVDPAADWDTPETRVIRMGILKANKDLVYAGFFRTNHWNASQISAFERITAAFLQRVQDLAATVIAKNLPYPEPAVTALANQNNAQYYQELRSALGEEAYSQFDAFRRTAPARAVANGVAGSMYYSDTPLTAAQGNALAQILATNSSSYQAGQVALLGTIDVPAALTQAQQILTPEQLASLKAQLVAHQSWQKLAPFLFPKQ